MFDQLLTCLTFLLKLNVIDTHQSIYKVGKAIGDLLSSLVAIFRSPYDNSVYSRKTVRVFSNIMGSKCSKYLISFETHFILFFLDLFLVQERFPRYEMHVFVLKNGKTKCISATY